jgi:hypothetical protein
MKREALIEAVLKDAAAFERVVAALKAALTRAWSLGHQNAVKRLLNEVEAIGPEAFTREMEARVLAAFEAEVGPGPMRRMVEGPVVNLSEAAWLIGAREAAKSAGVDYRFGLKDTEALKLAQRGDLYWVANHWDAFTRQKLSDAVARFFEEGQTYEKLAEWMREAMAGLHEAGMRYWELVADTAATKTREMGRIAGYEQAGIQWVQVRARMDERTTPLCRSLHGRLIPLATVVAQRDKYLEAAGRGHLEAARAAWPMWETGRSFGKEIPDNVGLPPYHFRCRTVTVAYLGPPPGSQRIAFGERMPRDAREIIEQAAPEVHAERIAALRQLAAREALAWSERHLREDLRKRVDRVRKHAQRDFGLTGADEETLREYLRLASRTVETGEAVIQVYSGRLQYVFGSPTLRSIAVVDWEETRLFGLYGHPKPGGFEQAWQNRYLRFGAIIEAQQVRRSLWRAIWKRIG